MSMKKMLAVVAAAALVAIAAPAFAANPFSDVPMNHWAYDAVAQLTSRGVISGYPDGTFKGNKAMTRYEIASIIARSLANAEYATKEDMERLKALVVEFQPELEALGVTVDGFDSRLTKLEKGVGGWKITGQMRFDYNAWDKDPTTTGGNKDTGFTHNRARLFLHKDLSDKVTFDARWHGGQFDRWWFTAKDFMGWEGFTVRGGSFYVDWEGDDGLYADNDSYFTDGTYRGFSIKKDFSMGYFEAFASSQKGGNVYTANASNEEYGARLKLNFNEKFWFSANAYIVNNNNSLSAGSDTWTKIDAGNVGKPGSGYWAQTDPKWTIGGQYKTYWVGAGAKFLGGVELKGAYYFQDIAEDTRLDSNNDSPKSWKLILDVNQDVLKFTSLWVEYAKIDKGFYMENVPWAFNNFEDWSMEGYNLGVFADDTSVFFVKAAQKWNEKWSSFERYVKYDMDNFGNLKEWSIGVGYQYSPALYFELAYNNLDVGFDSSTKDYDNNQIRFRTLLNF